ncbi:MAG: M20/M25/M40 family metallo-hydrolase [Oscillospiraceae bacterium]|nr:M20/M25/M40 family metallo-hydrolase [Oscillospiraceae bacterium]MDD7471003.1 M20/M25/M40 family metallo-hydrolase [Oscillospiraceae bacterium]MDY2677432.1 M20/M25/M40 family metallo-hydrolase [Oscillospiraceae bacterium]
MELKKIIEKKDFFAKYMIDEITHICKTFEKRDPGSNGEKQACEYMADVLKNDCGCDRVSIESFKENPGSFFGWIYFTITFVLAAVALFFVLPVLSIVLIVLGLVIAFLQFGLYKKAVDRFFPEKTGHNVTALKAPAGEVKRRIMFNGHPDAAWEWPVNYKLGGVGFESHAIICGVGALYYLVLSIVYIAKNGVHLGLIDTASPLFKAALCGLIFVPFLFGLYFMWNKNRIVDGANDNLSGCYMGIAILKALKDEGIELQNTELGVILTGSEEAGLRGSKAWCEAHKGEFDDVPTIILSYDTIHDPKYLMTNYRDLNGTVKVDKDASDLFMEAAKELNIHCIKGMVPPLGGATDSAAFAQAGFRATGITGLNHKLEDYYHTRRDTYDNMNAEGLAGCFAVSVKALEMFDNGAKQ